MSMASLFYFKVEWTLFIQLFWWVDFELCSSVTNRAGFYCMEVSLSVLCFQQ